MTGVGGFREGTMVSLYVMLPEGGELVCKAKVANVRGNRVGLRFIGASKTIDNLYYSLSDDEITGVRRIYR